MITYQIEKDLSPEEFISVLNQSTLAERRPVNEPDRIQKMLDHGNLIVTARENNVLIGVARFFDRLFVLYVLVGFSRGPGLPKTRNWEGINQANKITNAQSKIDIISGTQSCGILPKDRNETVGTVFLHGRYQ